MSKELYRALASGKWCITEEAAKMRLPLVYDILSSGRKSYDDGESAPKKTPEEIRAEKEMRMVSVISFDANSRSYRSLGQRIAEAEPDSVVVLKYHDVIIKNDDGCGNPGTEFLAEMIDAAAMNDNVSAIILDLDTPGGDGTAVQRPSAAIVNARKKKPVLTYAGNGMVASAGYWIASQTDELYAEFPTDEIGSIGTYITLMNYEEFLSKWYETKVESVYATKSTSKNKGSRDWAKDGNKEYLIKHTLDPFNEEFINAVKSGRGERIKDESVFDGRLLMSADAMSFGLIDGLKTFAELIERSRELSAQRMSKPNETQMKILVSGKDNTIDAINAGVDATSEQINSANTELNSCGLVLVKSTEYQALNDRAVNAENSLRQANSDAQQNSSERIAIATALGLSQNEAGEFVNDQGEVVTIQEHASAVVAQRNEYGNRAGAIEVDPAHNTEIEEKEVFQDPSLEYLAKQGL